MPSALLRRFMKRFPLCLLSQSYGQTECSPVATGLLHRDHLDCGPYGCKIGSVGRAVSTVELTVLSPSGGLLPPGEVGEVVLRGPNVMKGYWNKPAETAAVLRGGWLYTGDLGYLDPEGFLTIVDRAKDMVISGGENVYSAEVENIICQYEGVESCAVIGLPDADLGERVHAILLTRPDALVLEAKLLEFCRERLAGYKIPRSVEWASERLPLTSANKVDKVLLRRQRLGQEGGLDA